MEIKAMYFSPTKTSKEVICEIAETLSKKLNLKINELDITKNRESSPEFSKEDIFILALPVYGGRIPEIVEDYIKNLKGNQTKAIVLSVYGNADYGDALLEMRNILNENNFSVIAGGLFIGEHSFTRNLATDRPDDDDLKIAKDFANSISEKIDILGKDTSASIEVNGNFPYKERGPLPPVTPVTNDNCNKCMDCVEDCPTGAINSEDPTISNQEKCILCCECIKICPENAKYIDNEDILGLAKTLEENFSKRKEPELFI
ncbi:EFR1 family ferrodoxin [Methanobrevibacter sp. OttesenSCG-928-I08]|nr:EFR1 family ferrodoxin [Methanobrevibacter sp. OttesenSCG-928-I08]